MCFFLLQYCHQVIQYKSSNKSKSIHTSYIPCCSVNLSLTSSIDDKDIKITESYVLHTVSSSSTYLDTIDMATQLMNLLDTLIGALDNKLLGMKYIWWLCDGLTYDWIIIYHLCLYSWHHCCQWRHQKEATWPLWLLLDPMYFEEQLLIDAQQQQHKQRQLSFSIEFIAVAVLVSTENYKYVVVDTDYETSNDTLRII